MDVHGRSIAKHGYEMNVSFWMNICFFFLFINFIFHLISMHFMCEQTTLLITPNQGWNMMKFKNATENLIVMKGSRAGYNVN